MSATLGLSACRIKRGFSTGKRHLAIAFDTGAPGREIRREAVSTKLSVSTNSRYKPGGRSCVSQVVSKAAKSLGIARRQHEYRLQKR
ncbi:hypothetical protein P3T23_005700 [Paraburkholderia sp. GAS448]|uniref:hypothetical protein n=1 Tax=Paraburkholderia sp. GAS448 TaxID=3035136 RepID=UPI003D23BD91